MEDKIALSNSEKDLGNAAMSAGDFTKAVEHYTTAIQHNPTNHILYSNRSAAYASLHKYDKALDDAETTIKCKPDWGKGYSRKGAALCYLKRFAEAKVAYEEGLRLEPSNEQIKQALKELEEQMKPKEENIGDIFATLFQGDFWAKLSMNETTRPYLDDPAFVSLLNRIQQNPAQLAMYLQSEPRLATVLGVLMGLPTRDVPKRSEPEVKPEPKKKEEEKPVDTKPPETTLTPQQQEAIDAKEKGNECYKKRDFDNAIIHYKKAMELDPDNMTYQTNLAAVYFEMQEYEECITQCKQAVETGHRVFADYKLISRALHRIGNAYMKLLNYDEAINAYSKALTEFRNPETLEALRKAEKLKEQKAKADYLNPEISQEEKEKGNEHFKKGEYPEAIKCYSEAMKRNPTDHVLYSNRAACYTKLGEYQLGLADSDKCIELCPTFVKGYTRKGHIQFFMKQYHKCLETYDQGLKLDPENDELHESIKRTIAAINARQNTSDAEAEKEAMAAAANDPEIQNILVDPIIRKVLQDMQTDPKAAAVYMKDPLIASKIQKLIAAGILRTK